MTCCRCNSKVVLVTVVDIYNSKHEALVCTYCGRTVSTDKYFRRDRDVKKQMLSVV